MGIIVYNRTKETYTGPNNYPIYRPSILSNPYTDIKDKQTKALYIVKDRDEALERYDTYFDMMYSGNRRFQEKVDEIYNKYKSGETVYLECYCHPEPCHGDIIAKKLQQRLLREKISEINENRNKKKEMAEVLRYADPTGNQEKDSRQLQQQTGVH